MGGSVIRVEDLSKQYFIGAQPGGRRSLRDVLGHWWTLPFRRAPAAGTGVRQPEAIWALKDINFEVEEGTTLGVIGANGSGKSTLLKILSRITAPTSGRVEIRGRVGSLLEVGTGFHPELSGRDNIFLNGAILGMRKAEIARRFDDIVDFADIGPFLDTPVKCYSSGMYMRLAFAVAAHLEPEILFVDEVLAVGDMAFQKKCLGKMDEIAEGGRTVVFVSHSMPAIKKICSRVLLLDHGRVRLLTTDAEQVTSMYLTEEATEAGCCTWEDGKANEGVDDVKILGVCVRDTEGNITTTFDNDRAFSVEIGYRVTRQMPSCRVGFQLSAGDGTYVLDAHDTDYSVAARAKSPGDYVVRCQVPGGLLVPGRFLLSVSAGIYGERSLAFLEHVLALTLRDHRPEELRWANCGMIRPQFAWSVAGNHKLPSWLDELKRSTPIDQRRAA
jgi:lipopolysaccharide transport system ATP-binding protein